MSSVQFSFSVLDRFIHDVQKRVTHPTVGDAKRASSAVDDIVNNVPLLDELNVQGLRDLIKLAEKGKFTDMRYKIDDAISDYQIIESTYKKQTTSMLQENVKTKQNHPQTEAEKKPSKETNLNKETTRTYNIASDGVVGRPHGEDLVNNRILNQFDNVETKDRRGYDASFALHHMNPMITDIGDVNRPTKLAEQFSALYDNEWTDAFDAVARMEGKQQNIEKEIIVYLADVLRNIFEYTRKQAPALVDTIASVLEQAMLDPISRTKEKVNNPSMIHNTKFQRYAKQCVKETAKLSIPALVEDFKKTDLRPSLQKYKENFDVNKYIDKCLEISWLMNVHEPPMVIKWPGSHQNSDDVTENFRHFTKSGIELDFAVWPALYLYDGGPLVVKGVVQMN